MSNESLRKAKDAKEDEFYTSYEDIEKELKHYKEHFKGKTVICNCDDPYESNFTMFFMRKAKEYDIKRLICVCYGRSQVAGTQLTLDGWDTPAGMRTARVIDISDFPDSDDDEEIKAYIKANTKPMKGDGDFRSDESKALLAQADIVVTNPPFSLFREFIPVVKDKEFLILGNENALAYKEIFPMVMSNEIWRGFNHVKEFTRPDGTTKKFGNIIWFTNMDYEQRHEPLTLTKHYTPEAYPKYDNYDAINVDKVADIPCDYFPEERLFATKEEAERFAEECRAKGIYATVEEV